LLRHSSLKRKLKNVTTPQTGAGAAASPASNSGQLKFIDTSSKFGHGRFQTKAEKDKFHEQKVVLFSHGFLSVLCNAAAFRAEQCGCAASDKAEWDVNAHVGSQSSILLLNSVATNPRLCTQCTRAAPKAPAALPV
jgi:hypothetical protein